jgi:hypothetical protein
MSTYRYKVVNPYDQPEWLGEIDFCDHEINDETSECVDNCGLPSEDQVDDLIQEAEDEREIENYLSSKD